jgi:hypothetical protein
MKIGRSIALCIVLSAFAVDARADESTAAAAQALFKEGRAFLQQGKFADACERLGRSDKLDPAVGTRLSLGECHEGLGQNASAWAAYNQATSLGMQKNDPRADVARKRAAALEPKLAKITIRVAAKSPDLTVKRNGVAVDPAALDATMPVDAGPQSITANEPAHKPWSTTIEIRDGESKEISIPALEIDPKAQPIGEAPPKDAKDSGDSRRNLALGLEIGGGVALVAGLVVGGLAISKWSSVDDTCPDGRCRTDADRDRLAPDVSTARTLATASTVITVIGAAALAAGIVIHVTTPSRVAVVPVVDRTGAGVAGTFRF